MAEPLRRPTLESVAPPTEQQRTMHLDYQAFRLLQTAYVIAPILAGVDKFFGLLTDWNQYLAPPIARIFGEGAPDFMRVVGVIEIIAGIGVAMRPKIFAHVVAVWLFAIVLNLLMIPGYYDIALRDFGLGLGALALGRLARD